MPELTLKEVKTTLEDYQGKVEGRVEELIAEGKSKSDKEVEKVMEELGKVNDSITAIQDKITNPGNLPGFDKQEAKKFSIGNMVKGMFKQNILHMSEEKSWEGGGYEREVSSEYMKIRAETATDGTEGGYLIPSEALAEVIDLARAKTPLTDGTLPVTTITGLRGELPIPTIASRGDSDFVAENENSAEVNITFGQFIMRPRRVSGYTNQSRQLLMQSSGVSDTILKQQLGISLGLARHQGHVNGGGSDSEPTGILNWAGFTTGTTIGANGGRFTMTQAELLKLKLDVADELIGAEDDFGFLFRPEVKTGMKTERIEQFSAQGSLVGQPIVIGMPIVSNDMLTSQIGKFGSTTQIPNNVAKGSSTTLSTVVFGNWPFFYIGEWDGVELRVSEHASPSAGNSAFLKNQVLIMVQQFIDNAVVRPTAFTKNTDAETLTTSW